MLPGSLVSLERLHIGHAEALLPSAADPEVWRWKLVPRPETVSDMERLVTATMIGAGRWSFVVAKGSSGEIIGSTTLGNFDWRHGCVEMGFTWLARSAWGQGYNEDSKLVLLDHCFDELGMSRVEWQVDGQNQRSVAALSRLGFTYEGRHRSRHVRPDGSRRDSLYFSVLVDEWPRCKERLQTLIVQRSA